MEAVELRAVPLHSRPEGATRIALEAFRAPPWTLMLPASQVLLLLDSICLR